MQFLMILVFEENLQTAAYATGIQPFLQALSHGQSYLLKQTMVISP